MIGTVYYDYSYNRKFEHLRLKAKQLVPGVGPVPTRIMVIGEAPGAAEDEQGQPFVGASGSLLNQMLEFAGLSREECFITNVVKYRPEKNRTPSTIEIRDSLPYLLQEINYVNPWIVILLGNVAGDALSPGDLKFYRGELTVGYRGISYYLTYHPAAALRNPTHFKAMKGHFEKLKEILSDDSHPVTEYGTQ